MEDLRKEIKRKFDLLNPIQLGLIGYWFKCHNDNDFVTGSCEIVSAYGHATTQGVFDYAYVTNQFVGDLA